MAKPSKIEVLGIGPRVLTMAATMGSKRIAGVLRSEGMDVSFMSVQRYLDEHLEEREEATKQVQAAVQEQLQTEALSDVKLLEELRDMAVETLKGAKPDERLSKEWAAVLGQAKGIIETRLKIAGASKEEEAKLKVEVDLL